jgi:hypothetical protein
MKRTKWWLGGLCCALAGLAAAHDMAHVEAAEHEASTTQHQVLSLDVYRDGTVLHLLTGEREAGESSALLLYRRSADDGRSWSEPVVVNRHSVPFGLHRGGDAQIAADGKRLLAAWTVPGTGWGGSGPIATAFSADAGKTWKLGTNPADDHSTTGHSFIDIAAAQGSFHMVWLDTRDAGGQGLRYSRSADGRNWQTNATLAANTCECCWNSLLAGSGYALYALFRDGDPRDMSLAVSPDGGRSWDKVGAVAPFGWNIKACPHVGGALVSGGAHTLDALSWTGREGRLGLYHVRSDDEGEHWGAPQRIGGDDARHADLAADADGRLAAVWDTAGAGGAWIMGQTSADGGAHWSEAQRLSAEGVHPTHPRVVATADGFLALWTQTDAAGGSAMGTARIAR